EFPHEVDQSLDSSLGERVVDRRAHPTNGPVAFQSVEAVCRRFLVEPLLELLARKSEGDVHQRAAVLLRSAAIEAGAIDLRIQLRGLPVVDRGNAFEAAERF